jgi:hypothetical protein
MKTSIKAQLKTAMKNVPRSKKKATWDGPEATGPMGGITQGLISEFVNCRYRFGVKVIDGLIPTPRFNKSIEFGSMWHILEECYAAPEHEGRNGKEELKDYTETLLSKFPLDKEEIMKWYSICLMMFPIYVSYWAKNHEVVQRTPLLQEAVFCVPYQLPSGRVVNLRGKIDALDLIGKGKTAGVYLNEHKTKSEIDKIRLQKQLSFDPQTMTYIVVVQELLREENELWDQDVHLPPVEQIGNWPIPKGTPYPFPLKGVRYNVVRRPLAGGKGTIRKHQATAKKAAETDSEFYARLRDDYIVADPESYFQRWTVELTQADIEKFKHEFLNPVLEQICWWYDYKTGRESEQSYLSPSCLDYRCPFGIYNPLNEGGVTDLDEYLASGSTVGLENVTTLFPELE